jgi:hypothetical protein
MSRSLAARKVSSHRLTPVIDRRRRDRIWDRQPRQVRHQLEQPLPSGEPALSNEVTIPAELQLAKEG